MVKLTDDEIRYLFKFAEKKMVRQYDVQVELVDHLASHIEELMSGEQALNFSDALDAVYAGFGTLEFDKLVKSRTNAAFRRGRKLWWVKFKSLFKWPEILTSIAIFGLLYLSGQLVGLFAISVIVAVSGFVMGLWMLGPHGTKKSFAGLTFSTFFIICFGGIFDTFPFHIYRYDGIHPDPIVYYLLIFLKILCFKALYQVHLALLEEMKKQHSEVFTR